MSKTLDGKAVAEKVKDEVSGRVRALKARGVQPRLEIFLVGQDAASHGYVRAKQKACDGAGIECNIRRFDEDISEQNLTGAIEQANADDGVHGILVQLPLPSAIKVTRIAEAISQAKDVDCVHPANLGELVHGKGVFEPCTPKGILRLLDAYDIGLAGKTVTLINRSILVGKPLLHMLLGRNATVTICHSKTRDVPGHTRQADVVISAVGIPGFVHGDMVKEGAVVVDAGIAYPDGKPKGDVDFESVYRKAYCLTPVPGGVGPMTVSMVLENVVLAAERQASGP